MRLLRLSVFVVCISSVAACSSAPESEEGVADDAITANNTSFAVGDHLVTTARMNLREGPSIQSNVLTIMPKGASVTVVPVAQGADDDSQDPEETAALDSTPDEEQDDGADQ